MENTKSTTLVKPPSVMALAQAAHISAGTSRKDQAYTVSLPCVLTLGAAAPRRRLWG